MKLTRFFVPLMLLLALPAMALTDNQVINYIKTQAAAGKSQDQIAKELMAKGVTPDQIKRIKAQYDQQEGGKQGTTATAASAATRLRDQNQLGQQNNVGSGALEPESRPMLPGEQYHNEQQPNVPTDHNTDRNANANSIYGHDIFNSRTMSFEPNTNMATPQNYRLGPGDEVIIDIWGASEDNIRAEISPEGNIIISQIGPVHLNGMTVSEANKYVKNLFAKKYSGVGTDTDINLTLGNIRSILVDVVGEVNTPGTFRLSPFSNVFHAIYNAGGLTDIGSMRTINVVRNGKKIASVDFYDFLFNGTDAGNVRLQEGDMIIVPAYSQLISVEGNAKRPMLYEMKQNESLSKLLEYAGGFSGDAYSDVIRVERLNGLEKELFTVNKADFSSYRLKDGDVVTIGTITDQYTNQVELKGAVKLPGKYAISDNLSTLRQLLNKAEGLLDDAYLDRALIYRERPDRSLEVVAINIGDLVNGTVADIPLYKNDIIEISNINELTERGDFSINGYVAFPGKYPYAAGTTIEDLILQAGGLLEGASRAKVDVARRIVDPKATDATSQIAKIYSFDIEDNMAAGKDKGFILQPYDIVTIRKSPTYTVQEQVTIEGEVLFPGSYVLQSRNERLSEIIQRSGGLLESAYVEGAYLKRRITAEERARQEETLRLARANSNEENDSISLDKLALDAVSSVGINLKKAIENPGSSYDVVLQEGDRLVVPELQSTVKISGDVLFPNTVVYVPGKKLKYYIDQAGGYGERARKNKAYVVYMNGSAAKASGNTVIEPGCQIIVPSKPDNDGFDWTKVLSIATTLGSLASMTAAVVAIFKK
ncbi:MAG: SLBB domain-containing protein [Muribaculaceae bacterium]|nr:SLBB domain-containing protein [Muribaculaceae bacterium]